MATVTDIINYAKGLANAHTGVDIDGVYGMQCVDLPNAISQKFFGKALWGNAIDFLNSARGAGYTVFTTGYPRAGDVFVTRESSHGYGHTGLIIENYTGNGVLKTIEQNYAGVGAAQYITRSFPSHAGGTIIGWFRFPVTGGSDNTPNNPNTQGDHIPDISYGGHTFKTADIRKLLFQCVQRNILPGGAIAQLYLESNFGDSHVGRVDNNWSGMTGTAQTRPSGVVVTTGSPRPSNEGGYYMHYANLDDFFNDWTYTISRYLYNVAGAKNLEDYTRGLFRVGGAVYDYAAVGYDAYVRTMRSVYNGINSQNGGILDEFNTLWSQGKLLKGLGNVEEMVVNNMSFMFNIKGDPGWNEGTMFFYNGAINRIQGVHNMEELKYMNSTWKECTGRDLKAYGWTNRAPVYVRVFGTLQPGNDKESQIMKQLERLKKLLEEAV
jgi:hypothetical protein